MERIIMMTEAEYAELQDRIKDLSVDLDDQINRKNTMQRMFWLEHQRADKLWNLLNRPAIESLQAKHDAEFYDWCEKIAEKYDQLDEEAWLTDRAKWYNNGLYHYAETYGCKNAEEVYEDRRYNRGCDESPFGCRDGEPTEGWSDLPYYKRTHSWILHCELNDIEKRQIKAAENGDKDAEHKYRRMWLNAYDAFTSDQIRNLDWLL